MHIKHKLGFTLIELLLVTFIAAALILMGVNHYKTLEVQTELKAIETNVALLLNASNEYYRINAKNPADLTRYELLKLGLWPKLAHTNKIVACSSLCPGSQEHDCFCNYTVAINKILIGTGDDGKPIYNYQFVVSAAIDDLKNIQWYASVLNATSIDKVPGFTYLSWKQLPTYSIKNIDTGLWILNAQRQQFKNILEGGSTQ
jgi:Tfp pilus assembly protein PilE